MNALQAGGMGVPFLPVKGMLGSAYLEFNPHLLVTKDLFSDEALAVVQALKPDVTLVHGSKGDDSGNLLIPRRTDWALAIRAAAKVVATVEERVPGPLTDTADWRLIPAAFITALAPCPGGARPTDFPPYYGPDEEHLALYLKSAKDPAAWANYLQQYVYQEK